MSDADLWGRQPVEPEHMIPKRLQNLLGSNRSLRWKVLRSGNYMLFASAFTAVADGVKTAIYARTLSIEDYGVMALAVMAVGIIESFTTLGINLKVQQDGEDYLDQLPTYWTIKAVRGFALAALTWGVSHQVGLYYDQPELVWLIRALGFSFILKGLTGFGVEVCQRQMQFGRVALAEGASGSAALGLGLVFLWWFGDIWALVAYNLLKATLSLISSYLLFPWWPKIKFDKGIAGGVFSFGGAVTVIYSANYFVTSFDRGVLGKLAGMEDVGFYAMAYFLAYTPVTYLANIVSPVFLPTFKQIAEDPLRLRRAFFKALGYYSLIFSGVVVLFYFAAEYMILVAYGEKWLPAVPIFKILLLLGLFKAISTLFPSLFFIKKRPWLMAATTVAGTVVFGFVCIPVTEAAGVIGLSWAVVLSAFVPFALGGILLVYMLSVKGESNNPASAI